MTRHGIIRACERAHLRHDSAVKLITKAKRYGLRSEEMNSTERKFMQEKEQNHHYCLFYQGFIFILGADDCCITMYAVPEWFNKRGLYDGKQKIRNRKKYSRYSGRYNNANPNWLAELEAI